jgi:hypothetical protein
MTPAKREALRMMFGGRCAYCGCELTGKWHADHVEPVGRLSKWVTDSVTGYGKLVPNGKMDWPKRDIEENIFPACQPCNIHKGSFSLKVWRKELERITGVLQRGYPTYRHAVRFGQVVEHPGPIVFWFERYRWAKEFERKSA